MKRWHWLIFLTLALNTPYLSDTIYQNNAQGKQVVIQRQAIVVKENSNFLIYKHFDLKERRVEKVNLNQGSLPYVVNRSSPADRQQIVALWKKFGYKVTAVDVDGKTAELYDAYLDFYPPGGRGSLLDSVPARTSFPVYVEGGNADEIEFSKIASIEFQGPKMKLTLRSGEVDAATFLTPTDHPAEARLLGITIKYDPASEEVFDYSQPLSRLKEIRFDSQ